MKKLWMLFCFSRGSKFKIGLKVKLLTFLMFTVLAVSAADSYSQAAKFSLKLKDATVREVFDYIEENSEFILLYNEKWVDVNRRVDINVKNETVEKVLDQTFKGTRNVYKIYDRQIVILEDEKAEIPANVKRQIAETQIQQPQQKEITGKVTDAGGLPLPGVSVIVKGTTIGTVTNNDGEFSLSIPDDAEVLVFSFVGMRTQEIAVDEQTMFNVVMQEDIAMLEEVVAVGYGVQKKASVVAAISQTSGESLRSNVQGSDLANTLKGQLPGLVTMQNIGQPGGFDDVFGDTGHTKLLIRGQSTWNEGSPLILVDGVEREMWDINPYSIEKISVLKDASATAVFGVKGANGVILVTTLRGKEGKPRLTFDGGITAKTVSRVPHPIGSFESNLMKNHTLINEIPVNPFAWGTMMPTEYLNYYRNQTYPEYFPDVDWIDAMVKPWGFDKNLNMTASGGTSFVKYFSSFSYMSEGDIMKTGKDFGVDTSPQYSYDRFNFRTNLDFDITSSTRFTTNLSGYYTTRETVAAGDAIWKGFKGMPNDLYPIQYSDGKFANYQAYDRFFNPVYTAIYGTSRMYKRTSISTDFQLDQKLNFITDGLSIKGKLSYDNVSGTSGPRIDYYTPPVKWINYEIAQKIETGMSEQEIKELENEYTIWGGGSHFPSPDGFVTEKAESDVYRQLYYEFALNYSRSFGNHSISGLALMSRNEKATGSGFTSYREDWVGRATYNYDSRYLLELNAAYNGSEKFSRDYRFGFFPSVAIGWMVSNEPFFKSATSVVNNLKIRYSEGRIGSDAGIPRWLYVGGWRVTDAKWEFGAPIPQPAYPVTFEGVIPNPDMHWEVAHKRNIGIETGFFQNLLTINFDYFWENRSDIFITANNRITPDYFGANPVPGNLGEVFIKGWEIEAKFSKSVGQGLNLWAGLNWSYAIDEIIEAEDTELKPDYQKKAGFQIGQDRIKVNQPNGVINSWNDMYTGVVPETNVYSLPGDFKMIDFNSDGVIDSDDNVPFGFAARPQYNYSPSLGFEYKKLRGSVMFYGVYNLAGESSLNAFYEEIYSVTWPINKESWSPERGVTTDAKYPLLRSSGGSSGPVLISRAYLKIQSAELSYDISSALLTSLGLSDLRLRFSGTNLFMWSKMQEDLDIDRATKNRYPLLKRFNLGISFNF
jgi:TonB-linked SusC/RagA family outer membrane protein